LSSEHKFLDTNDIGKMLDQDENLDEDEKKPVQLKYMKLKYNFTHGSSDSMDFLCAMKASE
jgi:hypothetical protein